MRAGIKAIVFSVGLVTALVGTPLAAADDGYSRSRDSPSTHHRDNRRHDRPEYARVTRVEPIYTTVRVEEPVQECWQEGGRHQAGYESHTPTVVGGIIGGLIGNQVGQGTGNALATVGGALLGGSVGRDVGHEQNRGGGYYTEPSTRCTTHTRYRTEQRIDGYRVEYRYRGRIYSTITDRDPGDRIAVDVVAQPARR